MDFQTNDKTSELYYLERLLHLQCLEHQSFRVIGDDNDQVSPFLESKAVEFQPTTTQTIYVPRARKHYALCNNSVNFRAEFVNEFPAQKVFTGRGYEMSDQLHQVPPLMIEIEPANHLTVIISFLSTDPEPTILTFSGSIQDAKNASGFPGL